MVKDDEFNKLLNEVDNEALNTDLGKTKVSDEMSPTRERQVAVTLAVIEGSNGVGLSLEPTPVTIFMGVGSRDEPAE